MPRILHQDPILEAVCAFSLDAPDWDWTVPGLVYSRIKNRYPAKAEASQINFKIEQTPEGVNPSIESNTGLMQFWGEKRQNLVQIGPGQLSIHQLKPYSGWPIFKEQIESVLHDYEIQSPFQSIKGISLRYINRLPWLAEGIHIEDHLSVVPQIPHSRDQTWLSWFQSVQVYKPELNAVLSVQSGHFPQAQQTENLELATHEKSIILDLTFSHIEQEPVNRDNVSSWLEAAHGEIETMFFASLQEDYLQRFQPEVINE